MLGDTRGELDRSAEWLQPSSRSAICSFAYGTGGALPEPHEMTSSRLFLGMFLTKGLSVHEGGM